MALHNLQPAAGSTHKTKRVGRGQGSGMGKTATRGQKGQKSRTGYKQKKGCDDWHKLLQRRLSTIGFTSNVVKPYVINVDKVKKVAELDEITMDTIRSVHKMTKKVTKVKLIGSGVKDIVNKIKDENITYSGQK